MQARGLAPNDKLPGTFDEMIAVYIEEIVKIQPAGPYHIIGYSAGGNIAHYLAVRIAGHRRKSCPARVFRR